MSSLPVVFGAIPDESLDGTVITGGVGMDGHPPANLLDDAEGLGKVWRSPDRSTVNTAVELMIRRGRAVSAVGAALTNLRPGDQYRIIGADDAIGTGHLQTFSPVSLVRSGDTIGGLADLSDVDNPDDDQYLEYVPGGAGGSFTLSFDPVLDQREGQDMQAVRIAASLQARGTDSGEGWTVTVQQGGAAVAVSRLTPYLFPSNGIADVGDIRVYEAYFDAADLPDPSAGIDVVISFDGDGPNETAGPWQIYGVQWRAEIDDPANPLAADSGWRTLGPEPSAFSAAALSGLTSPLRTVAYYVRQDGALSSVVARHWRLLFRSPYNPDGYVQVAAAPIGLAAGGPWLQSYTPRYRDLSAVHTMRAGNRVTRHDEVLIGHTLRITVGDETFYTDIDPVLIRSIGRGGRGFLLSIGRGPGRRADDPDAITYYAGLERSDAETVGRAQNRYPGAAQYGTYDLTLETVELR